MKNNNEYLFERIMENDKRLSTEGHIIKFIITLVLGCSFAWGAAKLTVLLASYLE